MGTAAALTRSPWLVQSSQDNARKSGKAGGSEKRHPGFGRRQGLPTAEARAGEAQVQSWGLESTPGVCPLSQRLSHCFTCRRDQGPVELWWRRQHALGTEG